MVTISTARRTAAVLAATAFGVAAPLTVTSLADAAVHSRAGTHSRDADGDKMPNRWERRHGLNAHKANAHRDADSDGLDNLAEYQDGTDPQDTDSDDDGVEDGDDDSPDGECDASGTSTDDTSDDATDDDSDDTGTDDDAQCDDDASRIAHYVVG